MVGGRGSRQQRGQKMGRDTHAPQHQAALVYEVFLGILFMALRMNAATLGLLLTPSTDWLGTCLRVERWVEG